MELRDRMQAEGINRAELARRLEVSRARVCLSLVVSRDETTGDAATSCFAGCGGLALLELPERELRKAEALGDHWNYQVMTERELRTCRKEDCSERGQQNQKPALQIRQARFDDLPDKVDIDTQIIVDQDVAEPRDTPPLYPGVTGLDIFRHSGDGFAHDLEIPYHSILYQPGRHELVSAAARLGKYALDAFQCMTDEHSRVLHRLTAS